MLLKDVIGQQKIKNQLIKTVKEGRISHTQLFLGSEGSGNLALAIAYARYICCTNKTDGDSCNTCPHCTKYQKFIHPDLHFVFPVNTTKSVTDKPVSDDFIGKWRESILENPYLSLNQWYDIIGIENKQGLMTVKESEGIIRKLSLKSFESDYKIMIIWHPEKMHPPAANKLLKLIEEPPAKTIFLMVSENTDQILPTILSRSQIVKIPKIENNDLAGYIKDKFGLDDKKSKEIANLAEGNYQKAAEIINNTEEHENNLEKFIQLMRLCYGGKMLEILKWIDEIVSTGRERQKSFLDYSLAILRKNLLISLDKSELVYLSEKESDFSNKFHQFINDSNAFQITQEINKAYADIERNAYGRIVFLDLSLKLRKLIRKQN
ncbi:MAG: DNA polymerase III subunit delta [Bacteroidales bacterium]|nr:MAG: DNA polymerase III subunit delta [Bacteroidales bacterium]